MDIVSDWSQYLILPFLNPLRWAFTSGCLNSRFADWVFNLEQFFSFMIMVIPYHRHSRHRHSITSSWVNSTASSLMAIFTNTSLLELSGTFGGSLSPFHPSDKVVRWHAVHHRPDQLPLDWQTMQVFWLNHARVRHQTMLYGSYFASLTLWT